MVTLGEENDLGIKAFFLNATGRVFIGLSFIFLSIVIILLKTPLISLLKAILVPAGLFSADPTKASNAFVMLFTILVFCIGVLLIIFGIIISYLEHINFTYTLSDFDLVIKTGILSKKENLILYRQIRDINIERPFTYQLLGLSKIIIISSGTEELNEEGITKAYLYPIDKDVAEEIKNILSKKVGVPILETTKESR